MTVAAAWPSGTERWLLRKQYATRVRLQLQVACFDTYAGGWRLEERELTSQTPSSLRSYSVRWVVNLQLIYLFIYLAVLW